MSKSQNSWKRCDKSCSPMRIICKPDKSKSEILTEVLKRRNLLEEALGKIHKNYSQKENQLLGMIENEEEVKLLIATKPAILKEAVRQAANKDSDVKPGEDRNRFRHRRLLSKGSEDSRDNLNSLSSSRNSYKVPNPESESKIREKLQILYSSQKDILISTLESTFQATLSENQQIVQQYWTNVIKNLENKLASLSVVTEESEDQEKLEYIQDLAAQIEESFKSTHKSTSTKPLPPIEKQNRVLKLQSKLEIEQMNQLDIERHKWTTQETAGIQNECQERLWLEHEDVLFRSETELRRQAELEIQEVFVNLTKETQLAIEAKMKLIFQETANRKKELQQLWRDEADEEVIHNECEMLKERILPEMTCELRREMREELFLKIENQMKNKREAEISREISVGMMEKFEGLKQRLEKENKNKMIEIECRFEIGRVEAVKASFNERFVKIEKESKIGYLRKVDKLKSELRKEFEAQYTVQLKKLKDQVIKEKSDAGQFKAQLNVFVSQFIAAKAALLQENSFHEESFVKMSRELSIRRVYEDQSQLKSSPEHSNSPTKRSAFLPISHEICSLLPKPLPPPCFISNLEESRIISLSPQRRLLNHYNTKEIVKDVIMRGNECVANSSRGFGRIIETPARAKSSTPVVRDAYSTGGSAKEMHVSVKDTPGKEIYGKEIYGRKSLYSELLNQKFGVVEPRYKK